jgi:arylsulfatase A
MVLTEVLKFVQGKLLVFNSSLIFLLVLICSNGSFAHANSESSPAAFPNVVFILADDIGQGDMGFYHRERTGNPEVIPTPHLDKLAESGIRFDDAHTVSSLCAPSRYSIMTGNYSFRCHKPWGVWGSFEKSAVGDGQITLGQIMQNAGYTTAFFGKWNMGGEWLVKGSQQKYTGITTGDETVDYSEIVDGAPNHLGFNYSLMVPQGIQDNPFAFYENGKWMPLAENSKMIVNPALTGGFNDRFHKRFSDSHWKTSDVGEILASYAIDFIDRTVKDHPEKPFFIYYCSQAVHVPHEPPVFFLGEQVKGTTLSAHGDMIRELDMQVGALVEALKRNGQYENTIFIFSSDNGGLNIAPTERTGHDSSNGFRGSKTSIYEGGHRVPLIVAWPSGIKAGIVSNEPVMIHDFAATFYALTGQSIPKNQVMDSFNLLPLLMGKPGARGREVIYSQENASRARVAIRRDNWKLIIQSDRIDHKVRAPVELFNLKDNPTEKEEFNLISDTGQKERIAELLDLYNQIRDSDARTIE